MNRLFPLIQPHLSHTRLCPLSPCCVKCSQPALHALYGLLANLIYLRSFQCDIDISSAQSTTTSGSLVLVTYLVCKCASSPPSKSCAQFRFRFLQTRQVRIHIPTIHTHRDIDIHKLELTRIPLLPFSPHFPFFVCFFLQRLCYLYRPFLLFIPAPSPLLAPVLIIITILLLLCLSSLRTAFLLPPPCYIVSVTNPLYELLL